MSLYDPAADYALARVLDHVSNPDENATAWWHRAGDGAPVKAVPATWLPDVEGRVDLFIGRPGQSLQDFARNTDWPELENGGPGHRAVPLPDVADLASVELPETGPDRALFELAVAEQGTARDPRTFSAIAGDYLRNGPPGAQLDRFEQPWLRDTFRTAMSDAAHMPNQLDTMSELLESLPRQVRLALNFNREDDANIIKFGAHLAQHRVGPEERAVERFTTSPDRDVERTATWER